MKWENLVIGNKTRVAVSITLEDAHEIYFANYGTPQMLLIYATTIVTGERGEEYLSLQSKAEADTTAFSVLHKILSLGVCFSWSE